MIQARNLDFETLYGDKENNGDTNVSASTSFGNTDSITGLKAGTYLVFLDAAFTHDEGSTRNIFIRWAPSSGSTSKETLLNILPKGASYWTHHSAATKVELTADGAIVLQTKGEASLNFRMYHHRMYAIRIS